MIKPEIYAPSAYAGWESLYLASSIDICIESPNDVDVILKNIF